MELDKRIKEGKKPLDCFDVDIAKQFIGKKGYFSNSLSWYSVLKSTWYGTLDDIESQQEECFFDSESEGYFQYFLPDEWIKQPEKKCIPYTLAEWTEHYGVGDVITYRIKDCEVVEQSMFIGFQSNEYVLIGNCRYTFKELFNNYELKAGGEWQPFGVIDEQGAGE